MALTAEQAQKFWKDGYLLIDDYLSHKEADSLREACHKLVDDMNPDEHNTIFQTTDERGRAADDYFMTSGDKIRYFFEEGSKDENGKLKVDKHVSLNKIGHALHVLNPAFRRVTFDDKIKGIAKSLELENPVVCQSMYIFKQPHIGGEVISHQDSTFLYTDPMKLFGYWIALEDATIENGCLWFYPGSHKCGLHGNRRMRRNPDATKGEKQTMFTGENVDHDKEKFIPVPVKKGGLVLIHGEVVHRSNRNTSDKSRHIYTFHIFDKAKTDYSKENWLQPTSEVPFTPVYATEVA